MNGTLVGALVLLGTAIGVGLFWLWRRTVRNGLIFRRIAPALVEWDVFENLLTLRTESSHFLERHGPMTYEEEQRQRALSGRMDAAGITGHPVDAGRWRRHRDLLDALEHVQTAWNAGTRPQGGVFRLKFNDMVGDGFAAGTQTLISTALSMVIVRKGQIVTAFPVIAPNSTVVWESVRNSQPSEVP